MKTYDRDELIYLARIHDRAEKYEDMVGFAIRFIEMDSNLNFEERDVFSAAFKNLISSKRASWRIIDLIEKKEIKKKSKSDDSTNSASLKQVKKTVEDEINEICDKIQVILEEFLIPTADKFDDKEGLVFYFKLQGDYFRYKAEISKGMDFEEAVCCADQAYHKAYDISELNISIANPMRLGLALNFSVFYYEIYNRKEDAIEIAKSAFEESMKVLDELERSKAKDTIFIIQILKENLILWNNELMDD